MAETLRQEYQTEVTLRTSLDGLKYHRSFVQRCLFFATTSMDAPEIRGTIQMASGTQMKSQAPHRIQNYIWSCSSARQLR